MDAQIVDPVSIVRELKGPALAILWLMLVVRKPVSQEWLERHTGYTDKPIAQAIAYLEETGRIAHGRAGWVLAEGAQIDLPIELPQLEDETADPVDEPGEEEPEYVIDETPTPDNSDHSCQGRNYSDSPINNNDLLIKDQDQRSLLLSGVGKIPTLEEQKAAQIELAKIGISINDRTRPLLALSPAEIRKGYHKAINAGFKDNTGYIVTVLSSMLETSQYGKDWLNDRNRYKEWET